MYKTFLKYYLKHNSPEDAFKIATEVISFVRKMPLGRAIVRLFYKRRVPDAVQTELFGLTFPNPVGLAAFIDTDGMLYNSLSDFGFSFIEIGPLTYVNQGYSVDPKHYLGVKKAIERLRTDKPRCIISGNITRNAQSKGADVLKDYENAFAMLYDFVDMIVIHPHRSPAEAENAEDISDISDIIDRVLTSRLYYDKNKPVLLRLTPHLSHAQTDELIACCLSCGVDGVVAGGTLRATDDLTGNNLFNKNLEFVRYINEKSRGLLPIIAVGGIMNSTQADQMLSAGASLVEVYTGLFREGPSIVRNIVKGLDRNSLKGKGVSSNLSGADITSSITSSKES